MHRISILKRTTTEPPAKGLGARWRRLSLAARWIILVLAVLLVGARLALPYAIKTYVNGQLHKLKDYSGNVGGIDVHLWRGAYTIRKIAIDKIENKAPVPFFIAPGIDLSVHWAELFHGSIVGRVRLERPELNFVGGEGQTQLGTNEPWTQTLASLLPIRISQFEVDDGTVRFRNFQKPLPVNLFLTNLTLVATNLSNARNPTAKLPAGVKARGTTLGGGRVDVDLRLNPLAAAPTFELNAALSNVDMVDLNPFLRAYGKLDVEHGRFSLFTSVASADGKYDGFVKVLFSDLNIFEWEKERKKNVLEIFWQAVAGALVEGFKNHPHDQLATQIPISGTYPDTHVGILASVGNLLKNAFVRAIVPSIGKPLHIEDAEKKKAKPKPHAPPEPLKAHR